MSKPDVFSGVADRRIRADKVQDARKHSAQAQEFVPLQVNPELAVKSGLRAGLAPLAAGGQGTHTEYEHDGHVGTLGAWSRYSGVSVLTLSHRLANLGMPFVKAVSLPPSTGRLRLKDPEQYICGALQGALKCMRRSSGVFSKVCDKCQPLLLARMTPLGGEGNPQNLSKNYSNCCIFKLEVGSHHSYWLWDREDLYSANAFSKKHSVRYGTMMKYMASAGAANRFLSSGIDLVISRFANKSKESSRSLKLLSDVVDPGHTAYWLSMQSLLKEGWAVTGKYKACPKNGSVLSRSRPRIGVMVPYKNQFFSLTDLAKLGGHSPGTLARQLQDSTFEELIQITYPDNVHPEVRGKICMQNRCYYVRETKESSWVSLRAWVNENTRLTASAVVYRLFTMGHNFETIKKACPAQG